MNSMMSESCIPKPVKTSKKRKRITHWAISIDNDKSIYLCYAFLDGWNLSYTTYKFFFDLLYINSEFSPAKEMKKWLMTPWKNKLSLALTVILICIAMCAQPASSKDADKRKQQAFFVFISQYWPYLRDVLNALKNTYRVVHNLLVITNLYCPKSQAALFHIPIIIPLLAVNIFVLTWNRKMRTQRKEALAHNKRLLKEVQEALFIDLDALRAFRKRMQFQSDKERFCAYLSVAYIGFQDGLRSYSGFLTTCPALVSCPPILLFVLCSSLVYALLHWVMRIYDEYLEQEYARYLELELDLGIQARFIDGQLNQLANLTDEDEREKKLTQINLELVIFNVLRERYIRLSQPSWARAIFCGIKNSVSAYGAFSVGIIAVAGFFSGFPPLLFFALSLSGFVMIAIGIGYAIYELKTATQESNIGVITVNKWYEVFRKTFSSYNKGTKALNFGLSVIDSDFDEVKQGSIAAVIVSCFFSVIFGIKAFATGFKLRNEPEFQVYPERPLIPMQPKAKKPRLSSAAFFYHHEETTTRVPHPVIAASV